MSATQRLAGFVGGDALTHAVRYRSAGITAVCGGGPIARLVGGAFDPDDVAVCPQCRDDVLAESEWVVGRAPYRL
jgi:hypothetical protein